METTEKIVESYCRYVKHWLTIANIKCPNQNEVDLLAVDVSRKSRVYRYHIEVSVSISGSYSKLTNKDYSYEQAKERGKAAGQRMTLGHFEHKKFSSPTVLEKLTTYGFVDDNYKKIVVVWDWYDGVEEAAAKKGIELWRFKDIIDEIGKTFKDTREYFVDDTLRTIQLYAKAVG